MQIYAKTATGYCETEHCILVPANFEKYAKTIYAKTIKNMQKTLQLDTVH